MNVPNTTEGNWSWRFTADALTDLHSERLRDMSAEYGRIPELPAAVKPVQTRVASSSV